MTSVSVELLNARRLSGDDAGERATAIVPGLHFWWPKSGWQIRAALSIPKSGEREAERTFLLQIGNHLNWDEWLGAAPSH